jgi:hypothetical protein
MSEYLGDFYLTRRIKMNVFGILGVIFLLAFLVESLVEFFVGKLFEKVPVLSPYSWTIMYIAMGVGVLGAFIYNFDLLALLASYLGVELVHSWFGVLLTGLAIGRGANYLHDLVKKYFVKPEA